MIQALYFYTLPILLAAIGGLFSDVVGKLNIALESLILTGAFTAYVVTVETGSPLLGLVSAGAAAALVACIFFALSLKGNANIFVTGLGLNLLIPGTIATISSVIYGTRGVLRPDSFPPLARIGQIPLLSLAAVLLVFIMWYLLTWTPLGLRIRAIGLQPHVSQIRGLSPFKLRLTALTISGLACGVAGALLVFSLRSYVPNISAGKGWIALAAIYVGRRRLWGVLWATLLFGITELAANSAQGILELPSSLLMAFPYAAATLVLIIQGVIIRRREGKT